MACDTAVLPDSTPNEHTVILTNVLMYSDRGHGGRVVTLSPPISEIRVQIPARPQIRKTGIVTCRWSAVYSREP